MPDRFVLNFAFTTEGCAEYTDFIDRYTNNPGVLIIEACYISVRQGTQDDAGTKYLCLAVQVLDPDALMALMP